MHCDVDETHFKFSCNVWIQLLSSSRGVLVHHKCCGGHVLLLRVFQPDKLCNGTQLIEPFKATGFLKHACGRGAAHACGGCLTIAHFRRHFARVPYLAARSSFYLVFSREPAIAGSASLRCTFPCARNCWQRSRAGSSPARPKLVLLVLVFACDSPSAVVDDWSVGEETSSLVHHVAPRKHVVNNNGC